MLDKGVKRESNLSKDIYFSDQYFSKYQLFSLSEQISLLYTYCKKFTNPTILEVGKGNGFVSDFFKKANFNIRTFDINVNLEPDIVGNILDLSTQISSKSDLILCSEVLEHIDFDYFERSLEQLHFATHKYVIITLPEFKKFFGVNMQIRTPKFKVFSSPLFLKIRGNKQLGSSHFWEIDYSNKTSRSSIEKIITKYFTIIDKGYFHTNPYHNFYVLEKKTVLPIENNTTKPIEKKIKITSIVLNNFKNDSRVLKENISLQNAGYDVKVVALHEKSLKEFEEIQNIPVHRIELRSRGWPKNKLIQLLKYFEFIYKVVKQYKNTNILHCNDLNTLPIGFIIKKFFNKNVKIIYDAHEYETEINGLRGFSKTITKVLERRLIKYADKVITVSDTIANEYVNLYNIQKPALVLNTPPYKKIEKKDIFRRTLHISKDKTIFLYQGGLSKGRGIEILIDTFKLRKDDKSVIVFMGYGSLEEYVKNISKEYANIYFHKAVSPDVLLEYTSSADFGISTIEDTCLSYRYCLPNKMFEYLMAEIPVIVSNLPEMKRLVKNYNIGVVAEDNNRKSLQKAIEEAVLLDQNELQKNIQKVKEVYNWEEQEKVFLEVYKVVSNEA